MIGLIFYWIFIVRNVPIEEEQKNFFIVRLPIARVFKFELKRRLAGFAIVCRETVLCVNVSLIFVPLFSIKCFFHSRLSTHRFLIRTRKKTLMTLKIVRLSFVK